MNSTIITDLTLYTADTYLKKQLARVIPSYSLSSFNQITEVTAVVDSTNGNGTITTFTLASPAIVMVLPLVGLQANFDIKMVGSVTTTFSFTSTTGITPVIWPGSLNSIQLVNYDTANAVNFYIFQGS